MNTPAKPNLAETTIGDLISQACEIRKQNREYADKMNTEYTPEEEIIDLDLELTALEEIVSELRRQRQEILQKLFA